MVTIKSCHKERVDLWTSEVGIWIHFKIGPALLYTAFHPIIYIARTIWQHAVLNLWIILNVHDALIFCNTLHILTVGLQKIQVFCDPWLTTMMKALQCFRIFSASHLKNSITSHTKLNLHTHTHTLVLLAQYNTSINFLMWVHSSCM